MTDENISENVSEAAETQTTEQVEAEAKSEVGDASTDYEAMMAEKDATIEQLQKVVADKDKGLKKYKAIAQGKTSSPDDWSDDDEDVSPDLRMSEMVQAEVQKALAQSNLQKALNEKEELFQKVLRENKELRLANHNQPTSTPQGAGQDTTKASEPAEIIPANIKAAYTADMKRQGKTDEQIADFFAKVRTDLRSK